MENPNFESADMTDIRLALQTKSAGNVRISDPSLPFTQSMNRKHIY